MAAQRELEGKPSVFCSEHRLCDSLRLGRTPIDRVIKPAPLGFARLECNWPTARDPGAFGSLPAILSFGRPQTRLQGGWNAFVAVSRDYGGGRERGSGVPLAKNPLCVVKVASRSDR